MSTGSASIDQIANALNLKKKWTEIGDKAVESAPAKVQETLSAFMLPVVMQFGALLSDEVDRGMMSEADRAEWEGNIHSEVMGAITATFAYSIWLSKQGG